MKGYRVRQANESLTEVEVIALRPGYQVRYDFSIIKTDDGEQFEYDYVNVNELIKPEIKESIVKAVYPDYANEIALINNYNAGDTEEYSKYQALRQKADDVFQLVQNAEVQ